MSLRGAGACLVLVALLAGCVGGPGAPPGDGSSLPPGWDEPIPGRSTLADRPYYALGQSTTFLAKGVGYARYVFEVSEPIEHASVFFTTGNGQSNAPAPSIEDDEYHYEFIQVRPLGGSVRVLDVDAASQFHNGTVGHTFTLTYIYGKGTNYQFLAPFDGDPFDWDFEPGFYEIVLASDENLTIGANIDLGSEFWHTYYHAQELGSSRAVALDYQADIVVSGPNGHEPYEETISTGVYITEGEVANLFIFGNLIYEARALPSGNAFALAAEGDAVAKLGQADVTERLAVTTVTPARHEAFAYVALFNEPGPLAAEARASVSFDEVGSFNTVRLAQMLIFGVALTPEETLKGVPTA